MKNMTHQLVGLVAQTAIHAGASSSDNLIDLPIQRESHTDWPVIFGSGAKGAWRSKAELNSGLSSELITTLFGPDTNNAADHSGSTLVSDIRLLLLPVRSLTSHFKWVTCPSLLKRFERDLKRLNVVSPFQLDIKPALTDSSAIVLGDSDDELFLEEYRFEARKESHPNLIKALVELIGESYRSQLETSLTIVNDDQFNYLCRAAIPLQARIAIDNTNKVVKDGALWYEEYLPPETVMYNCLSFNLSRDGNQYSSQDLQTLFVKELIANQNYLQVGGNATIGMGWFELNPVQEVSHA